MTRSTGFGLFAMIAALVAYLASLSFLQLLAGVSLRSPTRPPADCVDLEGRSGWGLSGSVGSHQQMSRLGIAFIAFATVLWAAPASAHGCHPDWRYTPQDDWHSHDRKCQPHQRFSRSRARSNLASDARVNPAKFKMNAH
jgi:hypothetical protein